MNINDLIKPSSDEKYLVIGSDLDSFLSASLFIKNNPNTRILGVYEESERLYLDPLLLSKNPITGKDNTIEQKEILNNTLWIDADINKKNCNSLGHHIIRINKNDKLDCFMNSCNPNEIRKIDYTTFNRKYPLTTTQFLFIVYNESYDLNSNKENLIWWPDSSWIIAQNYKHNCKDWLENFTNTLFPLGQSHNLPQGQSNNLLLETFKNINTEPLIGFEERMQKFQQELENEGFQQGWGKTTSQVLKIKGFQLRCGFKNLSLLKKISDFINKTNNWPSFYETIKEPEKFVPIKGQRYQKDIVVFDTGKINDTGKIKIGNSHYNNLDDFLKRENVFSYVFPFKKKINYTIFPKIK